MVFAIQYAKLNPKNKSWSEILQLAWSLIQSNSSKYQHIEFKKTNGEIAKRVILSENWSNLHEIKGTGANKKEGQVIYTDAVKRWFAMKYDTGCYYKENLIKKF